MGLTDDTNGRQFVIVIDKMNNECIYLVGEII